MAISEGERKLREMQIKTRLINEAIKKEQIKIQAAANYYSQSNAMSVKEKTQKIVEITQESYNWMVEKEQQLEKAEQECNKIVQSLVNDMAKVSAIENVSETLVASTNTQTNETSTINKARKISDFFPEPGPINEDDTVTTIQSIRTSSAQVKGLKNELAAKLFDGVVEDLKQYLNNTGYEGYTNEEVAFAKYEQSKDFADIYTNFDARRAFREITRSENMPYNGSLYQALSNKKGIKIVEAKEEYRSKIELAAKIGDNDTAKSISISEAMLASICDIGMHPKYRQPMG